MVRLCVPAGDDQHTLTRRPRLGLSVTEPSLIDSPYRACLIATGLTAFRSIIGLARPGTFLRTAAFIGFVDGAVTACDIYGRQELNRAVFKLDGLEDPKPFKLWERTKQWTLEDASLFGGATGLLLASNPRLLPGATGVSRFFGVAIAGCAVGAKTAEWAFGSGAPYQTKRVEHILAMHRRAMYQRLSEDETAKASLSRFGRSLLMSYTGDSPLMRTLSKPFGRLSGMAGPGGAASAGHSHGHQAAQMETMRQMQIQQAHAEEPILLLTEFDKEELAIPDYERGQRQYLMESTGTDLEILQEHLEHLNKFRASEAKELAYIWQELAQKEHKLNQLSQEDPDKDILRREIQLLNSIGYHSNTRLAIISYIQADTRKRIAQIRNEEPASAGSHSLPATEEYVLDGDWKETYIPQKTAQRIRQRWETVRAEVAHVDHVLAQFDHLKTQGSADSLTNKHAEQLRKDYQQMKLNVVATERLLKEFEDQIHRADSYADK